MTKSIIDEVKAEVKANKKAASKSKRQAAWDKIKLPLIIIVCVSATLAGVWAYNTWENTIYQRGVNDEKSRQSNIKNSAIQLVSELKSSQSE